MGADAFRNSTQGSTPDSSPSRWHWPHKCQMMGRQSQMLQNEQAGGGGVLPAQRGPRALVMPPGTGRGCRRQAGVGEQKNASHREHSCASLSLSELNSATPAGPQIPREAASREAISGGGREAGGCPVRFLGGITAAGSCGLRKVEEDEGLGQQEHLDHCDSMLNYLPCLNIA